MKVVINKSYGGFASFCLSEEAYEYLGIKWDRYGYLTSAKLDPAEGCRAFYESDMARTNPKLVECVETLGSKADGRYAHLKIVEIPNDANWYISNCGGAEAVEENHRSWY